MTGPFKCPDCGVWWAGLEHRCRAAQSQTQTIGPWRPTGDFTLRCTCPPNRSHQFRGTCPVHDIKITYTVQTVTTNAIAGPTTSTPRGVFS